jgi:hypothetical protein
LHRFAGVDEAIGVWRSLVARFVRDEEVVGSNPATPTKTEKGPQMRSFFVVVGVIARKSQAQDGVHPTMIDALPVEPEFLATG